MDRAVKEAVQQRHALKRAGDPAREKAMAAAVSDVLDGTVSGAKEAARARGLGVDAVRLAVKAERERRKEASTEPMLCGHGRDPSLCDRCSR